jgi:hypothetical protein
MKIIEMRVEMVILVAVYNIRRDAGKEWLYKALEEFDSTRQVGDYT